MPLKRAPQGLELVDSLATGADDPQVLRHALMLSRGRDADTDVMRRVSARDPTVLPPDLPVPSDDGAAISPAPAVQPFAMLRGPERQNPLGPAAG